MRKITEQRKAHLLSIDLDPNEDYLWGQSWRNLKTDASVRGLERRLSFEEYTNLAAQAGIKTVKQIGVGNDRFQLGRIGDDGHYELGNCRFISGQQNQLERNINGKTNLGKKMSTCAHTGRSKVEHQYLLNRSERMSKKFVLNSPDGTIYEGSNLKEFCDRHNLNQGNLASVCRGTAKHHKGWTGRYVAE